VRFDALRNSRDARLKVVVRVWQELEELVKLFGSSWAFILENHWLVSDSGLLEFQINRLPRFLGVVLPKET
jgi:hypothetical protein